MLLFLRYPEELDPNFILSDFLTKTAGTIDVPAVFYEEAQIYLSRYSVGVHR